ncbi:MAG TPA: ATP-binding protein [Steroidobacteraceae bacterium]|nr:ATP-binding protein [Steroidobacteraceae bacterium]
MLSAELFGKALESAPDAIVIVDEAGRVVFANRQVSALFGYERGEIVGESVDRLLPERFRDKHAGHRRRYGESARMRPMGVNLELYALRKDSTELPVEISLSPIQDGERLLVAAAIRDVSERKRIQTEVIHAREAADRANQAKSRFLATASHDLRQPLQSLALLNGSLQSLVRDPTALEAISQQTLAINAMSRLLNALLDISKLESGAIRPDPVDFRVAALFEEMRREFANLASSKGLELRVDPAPQYVHSDPSLIGQILRNLISNAIKYTRQGSVELHSILRGSMVQIEVVDTGIGIPADQLPYICEEFFQVGVASNTTRDGYGLGLSIVQRIVSLLDLRMSVRSEPGRGSTFAIDLPLGRGEDAARSAGSEAPTPIAPRTHSARVLLVDDDLGVRNATAMFLKVEGYEVLAASSLAEAMQRLSQTPQIDLVVSDYHLNPGETGVQVIAAARELRGPQLPAILVTGDTSTSVRELQVDACTRVACKPIQPTEFVALIRALLKES